LSDSETHQDFPAAKSMAGFAEFTIGPAHRVRPLAGPMVNSAKPTIDLAAGKS